MPQNDPVATLNHLFFHHLDHFRFDRLLSVQHRGELVSWSTERFSHAVFALRRFLLDSGLAPGDRVAIFSDNRPEWHIADFAILLSRLVVVPVYNTLSAPQVAHILRHSGSRMVIVAGQRQADTVQSLLSELPDLGTVVGMEEISGVANSLPRIVAALPQLNTPGVDRVRAEALAVKPQDLATIVYTSGTTGPPKGVMLSHGNIVFNFEAGLQRTHNQMASQALSVLPLPHVLERVLCYGYFKRGIPIAYGDPHDLKELAPIHKPEIMGGVPRILEKVQEGVEAQIAALLPHRRFIGRKLLSAAIAVTRERLTGEKKATALQKLFAPLANVLVFPKVHAKLGGLKYFICGGAWLDPEIELFFRAAGFDVLQGYGMTETSPVIAMNEYHKEKPGSVGRAIDGVEVRISEDGEILTRGPHVMLGYYNDEHATRQIFSDGGWLHTGDLGRMDAEGNITITGRRKEILVLSNGKNIACAVLEQALQRSPYIQQALIVGEGKKYVTAMIVPHPEHVGRVAAENKLSFSTAEELWLSQPIVELFRGELSVLQSEFSNFERAKKFCFLREEALLDTELVTPTLKVRRSVLERKYADWITQMYEREEPLVIPPPAQLAPLTSYKTV